LDVLIVTASFVPDISPNARILSEISEDLVKRGHRVTIATPFPYHPAWVVPEQYRWKLYQIAVISDGFKKNLMSKGIESDKIKVIPNCVDLEFIAPAPRDNHIRTEYEI